MVKAVAVLAKTSDVDGTIPVIGGSNGTVTFFQKGNGLTQVIGRLRHLTPGDHALVVHTLGNITNGWKSTGHPFKHAGKNGVIGIITVLVDGTAIFELEERIPLSGPNSVIGRGLVVHSGLGPIPYGGEAWAVIGLDQDVI